LGLALGLSGWAAAPVRVVLSPRLAVPAPAPVAALTQALAGEASQAGFSALSDCNQAAKRATGFRVAWDEANLYLLVVCPLAGGPAFLAGTHDHDGELWRDDAVEVFIQPPDSAAYFHFGWNAAGTRAEERVQDRSWDPEWQLVVEVTDTAWTSLAVIPFACLGAPPSLDAAWRLNVCRSDAAHGEFSSWSFSGGGFHRPDRFGWLLFTPTAPGQAPTLSASMLEHVRGLFFYPAAVTAQRAQIAALLRLDADAQGSPTETPQLAALSTQLGELDQALQQVQLTCAKLEAARIAAFITQASTVPDLRARAAETLVRWRLERLLGRYENPGPYRH
jgi:hypothetical protein